MKFPSISRPEANTTYAPITGSSRYVNSGSKITPLRAHSLVPVAAAATVGAPSTQTLAQVWRTGDATASAGIADGTFTFSPNDLVQYGTTGTRPTFIVNNALYPHNGTLVSPLKVSFMVDAISFEIIARNANGRGRVWVDDQLVSDTPIVWTNDAATSYTLVTLPDKRVRRIDLELYNVPFGGITTAATDSVWPAPLRGPRTICIGDSFAEGQGANGTSASGWVRAFGHALGWDDVIPSGIGGTGYLAPGSYVKYRDRLTADVIAYAPDVVVWSGGINDYSAFSAAAIGAEAALDFAAIRLALPAALQVVNAPWHHEGVEGVPTTLWQAKDSLYASAVAAGCLWIDLMEQPLNRAAVSTTTSSGAAIGATTIAGLAAPIPVGSTVIINGLDRRVVTARSGSGPYTITVAALTTLVPASSVTISAIGSSMWTGTGQVGTTTGAGNCDLYVSSDGTHPSQAGHDAIGTAVGRRLAALLGQR